MSPMVEALSHRATFLAFAIFQFQSVEVLKKETDFTYRRWKRTWWENQRAIMKILAHHDSTYVIEGSEIEHEFVQRKIDVVRLSQIEYFMTHTFFVKSEF